MVSLRQRKSRPSYTSLAGLENISDGEGAGESKHDDDERASSAPGRGGKDGHDGNDSDASMSSGALSEFNPAPEDDGKRRKGGKLKGKGKGKGRARGGAGSESDFEAGSPGSSEDVSDGAESESIQSENEPMDDGEPSASVHKGGRKRKATSRPRISSHKHAIPSYALHNPQATAKQAPSAFDTTSLHPILKETIKRSAEVLAKGSKASQGVSVAKDYDRYKKIGNEGLSFGPATPFMTVLKGDPKDPGCRVETQWEYEDLEQRREARQASNWNTLMRMPLYAPSSAWQGEGWWKEMYIKDPSQTRPAAAALGKSSSKSKGKGKAKDQTKGALGNPHWKLREEVDLGLGRVGRFTRDNLKVLTAEEARSYLPDGPTLTCHFGRHGAQEPVSFTSLSTKAQGLQQSQKHEQVFYAGGPIWGMDWCPGPSSSTVHYLAVSTLRNLDDQPAIGVRRSRDGQAAIQIWSLDADRSKGEGESRMRCELVLCVKGGAAFDLKWMPMGARDDSAVGTGIPKLGILAAVQLDGTISFYSVPQPASIRAAFPGSGRDSGPIYLQMHEPLCRIEIPDAVFTCLDWMTGSRLVAGLSNGHGIVFDILDLLVGKINADDLLPVAYVAVCAAPVRSVAAARHPQSDSHGRPAWHTDPVYAVFGGYDGSSALIDIRDPEGVTQVNRERKPSMAVAWAHQMAGPVVADGDNSVHLHKAFGAGKYRTNGVTVHRGSIWSVATSDYHTMTASASADGGVKIGSFFGGMFRRRNHVLVIDHRIFEMDYDVHSNEYRMIEDFLPETMVLSMTSDRFTPKNQKRAPESPALVSTPAWSTNVAVHKVCWNSASGIRNAGWLASGMACGLGRVEWIEGRFV